MGRITKWESQEVASKLLAALKNQSRDLLLEAETKLTGEVKKLVPKEISELYEKEATRGYIRVTSDLRLRLTLSASTRYVTLTEPVPFNDEAGASLEEALSKEAYREITNLIDKSIEINKDYRSKREALSEHLYKLRSYSKIKKEFPEAEQYLDGGKKEDLSIKELKQTVKNLNKNSLCQNN